MGNYDLAIQYFEKAKKIKPTDNRSYLDLGTSYTKLRNYELAFENIDHVIRSKEGNVEGYYYKACIYANLRKKEECLESLMIVLSKEPKMYCEEIRLEEDFDKFRDDTDFIKIIDNYCERTK